MTRGRWLVSPLFDTALLIGPGLLSLLVLALSPASLFERDDLTPLAWLVLIPLVDVSHVYASLYRTYLDPAELRRRPMLYAAVPALVFVAATMLFAVDALWFWRALAYLAAWHFVRQQYGFLALYRRRAGERGRVERSFDAAVLHLAMLHPLLYWHSHLPRRFVWFVDGDFVPVPWPMLASLTGALLAAGLLAFVAKEIALAARGRAPSLGKMLVLFSTAATWWVGIVHFDSDYAFTVTNVLGHGIPYVALVWTYGRRRPSRPVGSRLAAIAARLHEPRWVGGFVGLLVVLALLEESLWDLLVWGDHPAIFGGRNHVPAMVDSPLLPFVVGLLALPQATHYVLDGFLWKVGRGNPELERTLLS